MKGLDIFIVRFLPLILFLIFGAYLMCAWKGVDIRFLYNLHCNSLIYALALYFISSTNRKYHCKWNRAMYVFLVVVPIINFLDSTFVIIPTERVYLIVIHTIYVTVAIYTLFMAIKHFIQQSIKRMKNGSNRTKVRL